uniref:F-box domain-containing protein n=1 Tax=Steinernema glaseri TaxID=37863 RepID=A0A1I7Z3J7_9BILA
MCLGERPAALPDDVLIRIIRLLDLHTCLSFRAASRLCRQLCAKYGARVHLRVERPSGWCRFSLVDEDQTPSRVLRDALTVDAPQTASYFDRILTGLPGDLFAITELELSLFGPPKHLTRRKTSYNDFTFHEFCGLAEKHAKIFRVERLTLGNSDEGEAVQFQVKRAISLFARLGTEVHLSLSVGGTLKEIVELTREKKAGFSTLRISSSRPSDVALVQSLLLGSRNDLLSDMIRINLTVNEHMDKSAFLDQMESFVKVRPKRGALIEMLVQEFCTNGQILADVISFEFLGISEHQSNAEERVHPQFHPIKKCPLIGYLAMIDSWSRYSLSMMQTLPSLSIPMAKIRGFAIDNSELRIRAKEGIAIHAEVYPIGRNFERQCDILEKDQVASYQVRQSDTHVWIWYLKHPDEQGFDVPLEAFHFRHLEEPKEVSELSGDLPFDLTIV